MTPVERWVRHTVFSYSRVSVHYLTTIGVHDKGFEIEAIYAAARELCTRGQIREDGLWHYVRVKHITPKRKFRVPVDG